MKKSILTLALTLGIASVMFAQNSNQSIGLRFGLPTEISYQSDLGNSNRIEMGLGIRHYTYANMFSLSGVYQWNWDLSSVTDGLGWYAGVGASVGLFSASNVTYIPVAVLGQIGLQYDFNSPLRLSLDYRPAFQLTGIYTGQSAFVGDGICLGARWRF